MRIIEENGIQPNWHIILKKDKKYHVYSKGLRPYGGFNKINEALGYIFNDHANERYPIIVQNENGVIINKYKFPLKRLHYENG